MKTAVRRKTAINAAAASSLAAPLFIGIPAIASTTTVDVPYVCSYATSTHTRVSGTPTDLPITPSATYYFPVVVQAPDRATAGATVTISWKINQPTLPGEPTMRALS